MVTVDHTPNHTRVLFAEAFTLAGDEISNLHSLREIVADFRANGVIGRAALASPLGQLDCLVFAPDAVALAAFEGAQVLPDGVDPGTPRNVCLTTTGQTATPVEQIIQEGGSLLEVRTGVDPADLQLPSRLGPIP